MKNCKYYDVKNWTKLKEIQCFDWDVDAVLPAIRGSVGGVQITLTRHVRYGLLNLFNKRKDNFKSKQYRFQVGEYDEDWIERDDKLDKLWDDLHDKCTKQDADIKKAVYAKVC